MARIAINGFGRIGRTVFKVGWENPAFEVVAINDLTDAATLAYLLKHDTNYGTWKPDVKADGNAIIVDGKRIPIFAEKDPAQLPWKDQKIDIVIESTGLFTSEEKAMAHITAGAGRVVISAPAKGGNVPTFVMGVNEDKLKTEKAKIISNASCTTNSVAPVTRVIEEAFGIEKALMTTVHGYTASQALIDAPKKDLREGRAAAENIIPTSTGAAVAVTLTIPALKDKFDGMAVRVPVPTVSLSDMTYLLKRNVTIEEVNEAIIAASQSPRLKGILGVTREPLVSSDFIGNSHSTIVDLELTNVVGGNLIKVVAWYDNEWGYAHSLVELCLLATKS
ncbi:MAG: type I glyceraldehyde-3-phosphate dehydrogenase [Candidatus Uhrbacteria bacterium]|nr:type I glyceraldehyde-3-phosphate dehydrogenase [Candidatus Uhrbacteria bacterium]